jgi:Lhr-like helicase
MPLLEAFPSELQIMKYKLTTLPRGTAKLPVLDLGYAAITLKQGAQLSITPQTLNYLGNNQTFETSGYSATIGDVRLLSTFTGQGIQSNASIEANQNATQTIGTSVSKTIIGTQINITATTVNTLFGANSILRTTLTVTGLDSGARLTVPITVTKQSLTS